MNKKGFSTGLVDFYATLAILLIIILFFFLINFQSEKITFSIKEQEQTYALEANNVALLYSQSEADTSKGTMNFAELIAMTAEDNSLKGELEELTTDFFDAYAKKLDYGLSVKIVLIQNDNEDSLFYHENYDTSSTWRGADISPATKLIIPLRKQGDFARVEVRTVSTAEYSNKPLDKDN